MKKAMIDYMQKEKNDDLYTPDEAIKPLLNVFPNIHYPVIWECCDPGFSNITKMLLKHVPGCTVISTDIKNNKKKFDFLNDTPDFNFDMIITNPPYSLKTRFLDKCYSYNKPFALLLPLTALEGKARGKLFREYGVSVLVLDERINFTEKKNVWFNTSWFTHKFFDKNNTLIFGEVNGR